MKAGLNKDGQVPVVEIFGPTIQGEGALAGQLTWFVRLGHCDYANVCATCDSMHAVDPKVWKKNSTWMTPAAIAGDLLARIKAKGLSGSNVWVTFSGGNPALWDLTDANDILQDHGVLTAVETQGSKFLPWLTKVDVLTISPKGPGMMNDAYTSAWSADNLEAFIGEIKAGELERERTATIVIKIPVFNAADLDFAEHINECLAAPNNFTLFLSVGNPAIHQHNTSALREALLKRYESIMSETLKRPALAKAIVLPQLHVLAWGNKQGV